MFERTVSAGDDEAAVIGPDGLPLDVLPLHKLKRQVGDYVSAKSEERKEAETARRYYHGDQWTNDEVKTLNERGQPIITYNRIQRKIDGVVGLVERLRQDPKAYPRTPGAQPGADIASAVLNYALDLSQWKSLSPVVAKDGAIEPLAGVEIALEPGDRGDMDVYLHTIEPDTVFYDPRSSREDFSDAGYMGIDKFVRLDDAVGMFPDYEADLSDLASNGSSAGAGYDDLSETDRQQVWSKVEEKSVRIVEHWYKRKGEWWYSFYTNDLRLADGKSPYIDEKGKTFCRFVLFSANVDHDNDRYAVIRNLRGPQDEINHRRSKGLHALNTTRIVVKEGQMDDAQIDRLRQEAHKNDGVMVIPHGAEYDEKSNTERMTGNLEMLAEAKQEIEHFGPNPQLVGGQTGDASGRAIQLMQQAGIAELGPYIIGYRGWKLRVYRAVWNLVQRYWSAERWVRVTDDEGLAQFIRVNGLGFDPATGRPIIENALGSLDVDIILDEGPDHVTLMEDTLEALQKVVPLMAQPGKPLPPQVAKLIITLAGLPQNVKNQLNGILDSMSQPDPQAQQKQQIAEQIQVKGALAKIDETQARALSLRAQAHKAVADESEPPNLADTAHTLAKARKDNADAQATEADTALRFMMPPITPYGPVEGDFAQGMPAPAPGVAPQVPMYSPGG